MSIGKTILTIDPGKSGTGYALWDYNLFKNKPEECGPVLTKSMSKHILTKIHFAIVKYNVIEGYMENQHYMETGKGSVCASGGGLVKLCQFAGQIIGLFNQYHLPIHLVDVQKWKGTLNKDIIKHRILKRLPNCKASNHSWDAVGIGLYIMGRM